MRDEKCSSTGIEIESKRLIRAIAMAEEAEVVRLAKHDRGTLRDYFRYFLRPRVWERFFGLGSGKKYWTDRAMERDFNDTAREWFDSYVKTVPNAFDWDGKYRGLSEIGSYGRGNLPRLRILNEAARLSKRVFLDADEASTLYPYLCLT